MKRIKALLCLAGFCMAVSSHAQAQTSANLQILNSLDLNSTIMITPGQSFTAEIFVSNLPVSLASFDLEFATLPTGVTLTGFTDTVPAGWFPVPDAADLKYGAANLFGSDINPSGELVLAIFQTSPSTPLGSNILTFVAPGSLQDLEHGVNEPIAYTLQSATIQVVPEPSCWALIVVGLGSLFFRRASKRKLALLYRK